VTQAERRVQEAELLGFKRCVLPQRNRVALSRFADIELVGVDTIQSALAVCFSGSGKIRK